MNNYTFGQIESRLRERLAATPEIFEMVKQKVIMYSSVWLLDEAIDRAIAEWNKESKLSREMYNRIFEDK